MRCVAITEHPWRAPDEVLAAFAEEPWACAFLSGGGSERARWSYLLRRPIRTLTLAGDDPTDAFEALEAMLDEQLPLQDGPPFQGGLAGLACYELGDRVEPLALARRGQWPDLAVGLYPALLAFDHQKCRVLAIGRGSDAAEAQARADDAAGWLGLAGPDRRERPLAISFEAPLPAQAYEQAVAEVVGRIEAGEIFQANIARIWHGRLAKGAAPIDLLRQLIADSPAPFAAYLRLEDRAVVSNSPERFVTVAANPAGKGAAPVVETRPIKGTRPRGQSPAEDRALAAELLASDKDRAENLMIVDLMRNDLARVCPAGSVAVPELFKVESFVNVHHLVSTVTGRLAPGLNAADLLRATFPPGSVTGAPKVQAMKVIAGLEPPRGPYCGAMFWAGLDGAFDSNVLIRTVALTQHKDGWRFEARAGAGIVADSDPHAERLETEAKIAALQRALTP